MRIALLTNGIYPVNVGGMQKHSLYLAQSLAENGARVDVFHIADSSAHEETYPELEDRDRLHFFAVTPERLPYFPGHHFLRSFLKSKRLYEAIRARQRFDFIYAQGFMGWMSLREKARGADLPKIGVNFHGLEAYQDVPGSIVEKGMQMVFKPLIDRNLRLADVVLSLGGGLNGIIASRGISPSRIRVSANGVHASWVTDAVRFPEQPRKFVFVGRYTHRKGIGEVYQAITRLRAEHRFSASFIGPIPENRRLQYPEVEYLGLVKEEARIRNVLRTADVLLCPSYAEGLPTVILEGMASGTSVIASNVGAVDAVVSDSCGWLIAPGNVQELEDAMRTVIEMPDHDLYEKKRLSRDVVAERFLWNQVGKDTLNEIEAVLAAS